MTTAPFQHRSTRQTLAKLLDLKLFNEILRWDAAIALLGAGGGGALSTYRLSHIGEAVAIGVTAMGFIVAGVIAGASVLAAFLDQPFLRKLAAIGKGPSYFLAPLIFTALTGVVATLLLIVWYGSETGPLAIRVICGVSACFFGIWSIASLIPDLVMLSELAEIKATATGIPDDTEFSREGPPS